MTRRVTIGFRLPEPDLQRLENLAAQSGTSIHDSARELVLRGLRSPSSSAIAPPDDAAPMVAALRADLAVMFEALLITTKTLAPEDARRFVTEKLPH